MHDIQGPRRRRNQSEIDQLVREFRESGLNHREFAQKIGVHPLTVARWIRSIPFDGTQPPVRSAGREITPSSPAGFVAVEVRQERGQERGQFLILIGKAAEATFQPWPAS